MFEIYDQPVARMHFRFSNPSERQQLHLLFLFEGKKVPTKDELGKAYRTSPSGDNILSSQLVSFAQTPTECGRLYSHTHTWNAILRTFWLEVACLML